MKTKTIFSLLLLFALKHYAGPFGNNQYVIYDGYFSAVVNEIPINHYGYRSSYIQGLYDNDVEATTFFKRACGSSQLKKPFVFVEGFSFDKKEIVNQTMYSEDYFTQFRTNTNHPSIQAILQDHEYDPHDFLGYSTFNWGTFVTGVDAEGLVSGNPLQIQKLPDLLNKLYDASYDIVFVDFRQGTQYIQNNGMALVKVLEALEDSLQASGSNEKITVCGASMGGLVTRYALNYLHHHGNPDLVDKFISFDSPQRGANIPFALQCLIKSLNGSTGNQIESLREKFEGVTSPAASQMLLSSCLESSLLSPIVFTTPTCSNERNDLLINPYFQWDFNARKISIINGSRFGYLQDNPGYSPGDVAADINGFLSLQLKSVEPWSNSYHKVLDLEAGTISCGVIDIPLINILPQVINQSVWTRRTGNYDMSSGSYRNDFKMVRDMYYDLANYFELANIIGWSPACILLESFWSNSADKNCFIPAMSAASLKNFDIMMKTADPIYMQMIFQGQEKFSDPNHLVTDFDVVYAPEHNQTHVEITDENIRWLLNEVLGPEYYLFQNETVPDGVHQAWDYIRAGRNVGKPNTAIGDAVVQYYSDVTFRAANRISLEPGFIVNAGQGGTSGKFVAEIYVSPFCPKSLPYTAAAEEPGYEASAPEPRFAIASSELIPSSLFSEEEMTASKELKIYPNPSEGEITIESNGATNLILYNALGMPLKTLDCRRSQERFSLHDLPAGVYTISNPLKPGLHHRLVKK